MKFVTATYEGMTFIGLVTKDEQHVINLNKVDREKGNGVLQEELLRAVGQGDEFVRISEELAKKATEEDVYPLEEVVLQAPIPRPSKNIFCIGKNYAKHAIELGSAEDIPKYPIVFSKTPTTVVGHGESVLRHEDVTDALDYEGELAIVISKPGRGISRESAMDHVFGYTIINDVTARDLQERHKQYLLGKSLDTSCPMGPYLVHNSAIENPHALKIETKVNGEVRQSASTEQFIFDIPTLIHTLSKGTTLEAGDIIATGTPAGVGKGFKPPRYLKAGDVVEVAIEGIGTLRNPIT